MKDIKHKLLIISLIVFTAGVLNGQNVMGNADTIAVGKQKGDAGVQSREQTQTQTQAGVKNQGEVHSQKGNSSGVKQVKSARPDWSKARGARPASVERPSGSRIPKGAGKPHGAKGPGRK